MGKAYKQFVKDCGWVVFWHENYEPAKPLINFGWWQSAAINMVSIINDKLAGTDKLERWIKLRIKSYDPDKKYQYPEITKGGDIKLKRQKNE